MTHGNRMVDGDFDYPCVHDLGSVSSCLPLVSFIIL